MIYFYNWLIAGRDVDRCVQHMLGKQRAIYCEGWVLFAADPQQMTWLTLKHPQAAAWIDDYDHSLDENPGRKLTVDIGRIETAILSDVGEPLANVADLLRQTPENAC